MAGLENAMRDCLTKIQSTRVTDRKKAIETMNNFLQREEVIQMINARSEEADNGTISWNSIFQYCHNELIQTLDKMINDGPQKARTANENAKNMSASLIISVVTKANSNDQYLSCTMVIEASLQVLEAPRYRNIVGGRYIRILNEFILPHRKYWSQIKKEWNELYSLSLNLYQEPMNDIKTSNVIAMLDMIIRYGCEHSRLMLDVKENIFNFMKTAVKAAREENDNHQLRVLSLLVTVCQKLQKECRMAVCKFGEEILENVTPLYPAEQSGINEKKKLIFDFLLIIVQAHHPNGVGENSPAAYAVDWSLWKKHLQKMYVVAVAEIKSVLKTNKSGNLCDGFLNLIVHVHKQNMNSGYCSMDVTMPSNLLNETIQDGNTSKKMRMAVGFPGLIDKLNDAALNRFSDMWPWLCILRKLLSTYPDVVKEDDYMYLLDVISKYLSTSKDSLVTDYLCKCCIELINIRKTLKLDETNVPTEETVLESIWQTVLSTIGLNQSVEWSHSLLQHMLSHLWKPSRGETVLKLYLSGVVRLSNHSLSSLYILRRRISFPDYLLEINVWSSLMRWMLPKDTTSGFVPNADLELYAHTLVLICLKNNVKNNYIKANPLDLDTRPDESTLSAVDIFTLMSCESEMIFQTDASAEKSTEKTNHQSSCILNEHASGLLVHLIEIEYTSLCEKCAKSDDRIEVFMLLNKFNLLLLHLQKFHVYYDIAFDHSLQVFSHKSTERLVIMMNTILATNKTYDRLGFLTSLSRFFNQLGVLPRVVVDSVLENFYQSLSAVVGIIQSTERRTVVQEDGDMETNISTNDAPVSLLDIKQLSYDDKLKVEACKVLLYYCYNREFRNDDQHQLLLGLLNQLYELRDNVTPLCLLQLVVPAVETALRMNKLDSEIINLTVFLLLALCDPGEWYSVEESAILILKSTRKTISMTRCITETIDWECMFRLFKGIEKSTETYGSATIAEVVQCFGLLLKARCGIQTKAEIREGLVEMCDKLLYYLKHDFHEVRITAAIYVAEIFKMLDQVFEGTEETALKNEVLSKFYEALQGIFIFEEMLNNEEDDITTRPIVVLYSVANGICHSQSARRELLFFLFSITHEKRMNKTLVCKILMLVGKILNVDSTMHLIRDNSLYLLWKWYKKYKSFENFPFEIVQLSNEVNFYEEFLRNIIPILLFYGETNKIEEIAAKLETSISEITLKCINEIIALHIYRAVHTSQSLSQNDGIPAEVLLENLEESIKPRKINDIMRVQCPNVMIELFRNLHDSNYGIPANSILPSPAPHRSDERLLCEEIQFIQSVSVKPQTHFIVCMVCNSHDSAQIILQQLYMDVMNASTPEIKLESLQKYIFLCDLLLPHYEVLNDNRLAVFVCRTIIANLLHFVSEDRKNLVVSVTSLEFVRKFAQVWLSKELNRKPMILMVRDLLDGTVDDLVRFGLRNDTIGLETIKTLEVLLRSVAALQLLCNVQCVDLEPFPELPQFEVLNLCYVEMQDTQIREATCTNTQTKSTEFDFDIKKFLSIVENSKKCRVESLKCLRNQLSENRDDLKKMFVRLSFKRIFSEECAVSLPHRLVCALLRLTSFGDDEVKYEAAHCLEEIGLVDLHTLVLKPNCDQYDKTSNAATLITVQLCHMLAKCLVEKNVDVIEAASEATYAIFKSPEGFKLSTEKIELKRSGDYLLLFPFYVDNSVTNGLWSYFDIDLFRQHVDDSSIWSPETSTTFSSWIKNITCAILASFKSPCYLNVLSKICRIKESFAEEIFKYLINLILKCTMKQFRAATTILSAKMNDFFKNHFDMNFNEVPSESWSSSRSTRDSVKDIHQNKRAVQCLLDVVHFIRLKQAEPNLNELNLNYLYVAKAAQFCTLYFTSVLYAELWINFQIQDNRIDNNGNVVAVLEEIANNSPKCRDEFLNILREAFSKIGDSDALYGCGSSVLLNTRSRILHYAQTENWPRVMQSCDVLMSSAVPTFSDIKDLSTAIGLSGFNYLQNQYLSSVQNLNPLLKDLSYEARWKLEKWDLSEPSDDEKTFAYYQYASLRDIKQGNLLGAKMNVENARTIITPVLSRTCLESTKNIYSVLSKLQCLQDIENYLKSPDNIANVMQTWKTQDEFNSGLNFKNKEIILHQRICMLPENDSKVSEFILDMAKLARKKSNATFADYCLASIKETAIETAESKNIFRMRCFLEEAKGLWSRQETDIARYILQNLLRSGELERFKSFHSKLLRIYGNWLSEINLENADDIYYNYFKPATEKLMNVRKESTKERKSRLKTFKCVSEFADLQYQQLNKYIASDDFKARRESIKQAEKESNAFRVSEEVDDESRRDILKTKMQLSNQSKIDKGLLDEAEEKRERYLLLAMEYYLRWLIESEDDLRMFRVISLFVDNKDSAKLNLLMKKLLLMVPSYKFIIVMPQLSAHITRNSTQAFGHSVKTVVEMCARDHPHHTLPLILSLAKYVKDDEYKTKEKIPSGKKTPEVKEERVLAAVQFMGKFGKDEKIGEIARQMEIMSDAYIELAYFKSNENKPVKPGDPVSMDLGLKMRKLPNIEKALCPTINLPINKSCNYEHVIGIRKIDLQFTFVGGVNAPKKIKCHGTGGEVIHQLVKGRDDIRQDAVMQQVFTIMNKLLSENKHTSKRKLLLRTYKVVPLSQRSGILEWCSNTMALGDYLAKNPPDNSGAHRKYRPQDMDPYTARTRIAKTSKVDRDRLRVFNEICQKLKPVFRYFFLEKFPSPTMWFERKLAYTHSVAVTSIVGYIIGLGDRHPQNILIDEKTAEVIHIDFGIAFDQGALLNFPEFIPFRLTRDIEDGMGAFSIDGIFRRCCEQTLTVMRQNKNIIQTTLEVFLYDPLYQWTVTPEKKAAIHDTTFDQVDAPITVAQVNMTAPRALDGVILKLQGLNEGTCYSVEGQVNRLIQQAKDPNNLSKLFQGWQAYL